MDFDAMTKENCIAYVIDSGDKTEEEMKANLDIQIDNLKNPATVSKSKEW